MQQQINVLNVIVVVKNVLDQKQQNVQHVVQIKDWRIIVV